MRLAPFDEPDHETKQQTRQALRLRPAAQLNEQPPRRLFLIRLQRLHDGVGRERRGVARVARQQRVRRAFAREQCATRLHVALLPRQIETRVHVALSILFVRLGRKVFLCGGEVAAPQVYDGGGERATPRDLWIKLDERCKRRQNAIRIEPQALLAELPQRVSDLHLRDAAIEQRFIGGFARETLQVR